LNTTLPLAGVELGGTKCVCILAYGPHQLVERHEVETTTPQETLPAVARILQVWRERYGIRALGIACFGPIELRPDSSRYGTILSTNKPHWPGTDVLATLAGGLDVPVALDTDVNGAALAETFWGCAQGLADFAYVTVGTGVGVGLIVRGRPAGGASHSEIGHMRVPRLASDTGPSACRYHNDCVEGFASGSALKLRLGNRSVEDVGEDDPVWDPIVAALAAMCHALVCSTAPFRIAIGGGVASRQPHLIPRIEAALIDSLGGYMPLPGPGPFIVNPSLGDLAGPLGAIALALEAERESETSDMDREWQRSKTAGRYVSN
jgi:fructokinase